MNNNTENKGKGGTIGCLIVIAAVIWFIMSVSSSSQSRKAQESKAFENQLHKNPSTWTQQEKTRYNNFADWLGKQ